MAIEFSVADSGQLLVIAASGMVSLGDRRRVLERLLHDEMLPAQCNVLIDVSYVQNAPAAAEVPVIGAMVEVLRTHFHGRVAIVNPTAGHLTVSNLIALSPVWKAQDGGVEVFPVRSAALEWLRGGGV